MLLYRLCKSHLGNISEPIIFRKLFVISNFGLREV